MPCCCHSVNKRIIIVRGDDTDFNDRTLLTLRLSSDVLDLSTFKATLTLFSLVREYDDLTQNLTVNYSAEETMTLPYGNITGVLRLYDTSERVDTIETNIPFQVVSEVEAREIELRDSYYSVEITDGEETILNIAIESAISVRIGQVQTLQPDEPAYVTNVGSNNHLILNFGIPQGIQGEQGEKGDTGANGQDGRDGTDGRSAEMRIGAVETLQPTQNAYVINTGTSLNAILDFGIPKGDKGDKGDTGNTGSKGDAATVAVGTVTTLRPSEEAYVQNVGTTANAIFNFGIPKGDTGSGANADFSDITGSPYDCTALATVLNGKQDTISDLSTIRSGAEAGATALQPNTAITGATKCKITYDSKGLVTGGADLTSGDITTALGFTPYNSTNPNGYITGITSSMVTTALGYTPYNSSNPSGYQANVIETVKVNGSALTPSNKAVDITVPTVDQTYDGTSTNAQSGVAIAGALSSYVLSSSLATVATSGSYNDLSNKPTIPESDVFVVTYGASNVYSDVYDAYTSNKVVLALKDNYVYVLSNFVNNSFTFSCPTRLYKFRIIYLTSENSWIEGDTLKFVKSVNSVMPNDVTGDIQLATVASSGSYNDLSNKPTIPTTTSSVTSGSTAALTSGGAYTNLITDISVSQKYDNVFFFTKNGLSTTVTINNVPHSDRASTLGSSQVGSSTQFIYLNSNGVPTAGSTVSTAGISGSYNDLTDKPTIPTVGDGTLTITQGGTTKGTFTANASSNATIDIDEGRVYTAGTGIEIDDNEISVDSVVAQYEETASVDVVETVQPSSVDLTVLLASITGYDATKTQSLKNVQGVIQWVDD